MQIQRHLIAAASALLFAAPAFSAAVISTTSGSLTSTSGWAKVGQTFTATSDANVLQDWSFNLAGRAGGGNVLLSVFAWNGTTTGATLFSQTLAWNAAGGVHSLLNLNLNLIDGQRYATVVDLLGFTGFSLAYTDNRYTGGNGIWNNGGSWNSFTSLDSVFQARFGSSTTADANAVPEPGSLALLGIAAFGLAIASRRRKV